MAGLCTGLYGLLDGTAPAWLGLPALAAGSALCVAGLALGGRRVRRTTYRPDPWRGAEWGVAGCGLAAAVLLCVSVGYDATALNPSLYPLSWPSLPLVPALALLLAGAAGVLAPPPGRPPVASALPSPRTTPDRELSEVSE